MKKLKYILTRIKNMNFKQMHEYINIVNKESGLTKIAIFFDMIYCGFKYQAGYVDYSLYQMYNLNKEQRTSVLTRGKNDHYVKMLNSKESWNILGDKTQFDQRFKKYLNRDFFILTETNYSDFASFIKGKKQVIVKPTSESCGKGVEKITIKDYKPKDLYDKLIANKQMLVEEVAKQHPDMNKLHPSSVNTIRIVTIKNKHNITSLIVCLVRIGTKGQIVDNFNHGGLVCLIDPDTGRICGNAIDKQGNIYEKHPDTNVTFIGYKIPLWSETKEMIKKASKEVPDMNFIGWDVCISPTKPTLIEANPYPGHDLYQTVMINKKDKIGMVPVFEEALNKTEE